ncbi:MAG: PEP-CTERM sorting domain-containing protein [Burkholderiales bacterium]|nr:PEP-CTERM sorting domain-containing protein [Burkholderiales bacterium]
MATYKGYLPPGTTLFNGDFTTSPSGVYYGMFAVNVDVNNQPNGYEFWIVPGSSPSASGCCNGYSPVTGLADTNLGGYFARMETNGTLTVYTSATGTNQGTVLPVGTINTPQVEQPPYFAQVGDDGSFTIYSGSAPTGNDNSGSVFSVNQSHGAVTGINLQTLTYDYGKAKFTSTTGVGWLDANYTNDTPLPQQQDGTTNVSYSQTATLSFSVADAVSEGISANVTWGIPGIAKDSLGFQITNTTTITHGRADTTSTTVSFTAGARPVVPPGETYNIKVTATAASYSIPYSWSGLATYEDGTTAQVVGEGLFEGASQGDFQVTTTCISANCTALIGSITQPAEIAPIPEPGTWLLFALGLVGIAWLNRLRRFGR